MENIRKSPPGGAGQPPAGAQVDAVVLSAMRQVKSLLDKGVSREGLGAELSAMLAGLRFDRCAIWRVRDDEAVALYRYVREGAALSPDPERLARGQDAWLFESATGGTVKKVSAAGVARIGAPMSGPQNGRPLFLLTVDFLPSGRAPAADHSDASLQFMSDILCALFRYTFPE